MSVSVSSSEFKCEINHRGMETDGAMGRWEGYFTISKSAREDEGGERGKEDLATTLQCTLRDTGRKSVQLQMPCVVTRGVESFAVCLLFSLFVYICFANKGTQ